MKSKCENISVPPPPQKKIWLSHLLSSSIITRDDTSGEGVNRISRVVQDYCSPPPPPPHDHTSREVRQTRHRRSTAQNRPVIEGEPTAVCLKIVRFFYLFPGSRWVGSRNRFSAGLYMFYAFGNILWRWQFAFPFAHNLSVLKSTWSGFARWKARETLL